MSKTIFCQSWKRTLLSVSGVLFHKHTGGVRHMAGEMTTYISVSMIEQKNNEKGGKQHEKTKI